MSYMLYVAAALVAVAVAVVCIILTSTSKKKNKSVHDTTFEIVEEIISTDSKSIIS